MIDRIKQQGYINGDSRPGRHSHECFQYTGPQPKPPMLSRQQASAYARRLLEHLVCRDDHHERYGDSQGGLQIRDPEKIRELGYRIVDAAVEELQSLRKPVGNPMELPIAAMGLDIRTANAIEERFGFVFVKQLLTLTPGELLTIPNCGPKTLEKIAEGLERIGLKPSKQLREGKAKPAQATDPHLARIKEADRQSSLAEVLHRLRVQAGLSQYQLAVRSGCAPTQIGDYESGKVKSIQNPAKVTKIADALGLAPDSIEYEQLMNAAGYESLISKSA